MAHFSTRRVDDVIPRRLHQTYPFADLSPELASNVADLRRDNPAWQYRLYDDNDIGRFIVDHYGRNILELFENISPEYGAARADLFRYLLIYAVGGVYLDVKSRFDRPIATVIGSDDAYVLSQWRNGPGEAHEGWGLHADLADVPGGEFQQWHVIAVAGHPFLRAVIERVLYGIEHYRVSRDETGWLGVLRLTGPIAYTRAIVPLIGRYPCRRVADESVLGLRYSVLGGDRHKTAFRRHYTVNTLPVVRRGHLLGLADRAYLAARARKRAWQGGS